MSAILTEQKRKEEMMERNIEVMNKLEGFNIVIVCCSSQQQANFWQSRLEAGRGAVLPLTSVVLAVQEDWPGGAGNALGTLYAFQNAATLARDRFGLDISTDLREGRISVGLFHTAGKGTRLAPLPGSENNNKPGVKLPAGLTLADGRKTSITILEAVIKQTGCYAASRMGRLSVFWGDQVFIPTVPVEYTVTHHADILCALGPMLSEEEWVSKGMDKYGLIAQNAGGNAAQVEKVSHATAVELLAGLGEITSVGASLGSFSVSSALLFALLEEFATELSSKVGKLDSDPHLWMPMTLEKTAYLQLMTQKGIAAEVSAAHFDRMQVMLTRFQAQPGNQTLGLFGAVDVGEGVYWWDYGQLPLYLTNALRLTDGTNEAKLMRKFFGFEENALSPNTIFHNASYSATAASENEEFSCVSGSIIGSSGSLSHIRKSVVSGSRVLNLEARGAVLINVTARRIFAEPLSIVYNVVDDSEEGLVLGRGDVIVGVFNADGTQELVKSNISIDGGKAWEKIVEGNVHSFEQIYNLNAEVCPLVLEGVMAHRHSETWSKISSK